MKKEDAGGREKRIYEESTRLVDSCLRSGRPSRRTLQDRFPSLGSTPITTQPPSSFLLYKLRIRDSSLSKKVKDEELEKSGSMDKERTDVYGHSVLKDEYIAHSERVRNAESMRKLRRCASLLTALVDSSPKPKRMKINRNASMEDCAEGFRMKNKGDFQRQFDKVIDKCTQFHSFPSSRMDIQEQKDTFHGRENPVFRVPAGHKPRNTRRQTDIRKDLTTRISDPSQLVLRFERNMRLHKKKTIARARSFLSRN